MELVVPKVHSFDGFFVSNLDQRREHYIEVDPKFKELELILFSRYPKLKGQRIIYMPEMVEASFFMDDSIFTKLRNPEGMNYAGQCHAMSYNMVKSAPKKAKAVLFHGFYLINNYWRLHSFMGHENNGIYEYIDVTGNESTIAYGRPVDLTIFEKLMM